MKLIEALRLVNGNKASGLPERTLYLATAFTPLHYATLLAAHLQQRASTQRICIQTGFYGDLEGNLERMNRSGGEFGVVHLEWPDLDARLGLRQLGGWNQAVLGDVLETVEGCLTRVAERLAQAPMRVTVVLPTLPLPPMAIQRPNQIGAWEGRLRLLLAEFVCRISGMPNVSVLHPDMIETASPLYTRRDIALELKSGHPYTLAHADSVASAVARLVMPEPPLKGLITDLDNTFWEGILGEDGVEGVHWDLDRGSQMHAVYQQFLAALADAGVLIAVASKNEESLVHEAFKRGDLQMQPGRIFPIAAGWDVKSKSVRRILQAWNIGPEAVAFIDDSPLELAEVEAEFPEMHCVVFPFGDARKISRLLTDMRWLFGRERVGEEDALRLESLRKRADFDRDARNAVEAGRDFLQSTQAEIVLSRRKEPAGSRAMELVNKTNQFNLNGRRYTAGSWVSYFQDPNTFLTTAAYRDKFGELGRIAVLLGRHDGPRIRIDTWVMSCRAFSRRIEHRIIRELFDRFGAQELWFDFQPTDRNGPLAEFLESLLQTRPAGPVFLTEAKFRANCPALHQKVTDETNATTGH